MSKSKGEETNWAEVDKRIRARRPMWAPGEVETLEQTLRRLPDVATKAEALDVEQPAVGPRSTGPDHEPAGRPADQGSN